MGFRNAWSTIGHGFSLSPHLSAIPVFCHAKREAARRGLIVTCETPGLDAQELDRIIKTAIMS